MPHYSNGRLALAGDLVRGRGYNVKREVEGIVLGVSQSASCNLRIAIVEKRPVDLKLLIGRRVDESDVMWEACLAQEYGEANAFVAIDPADGSVLLPEMPDGERCVGGPLPVQEPELNHQPPAADGPA